MPETLYFNSAPYIPVKTAAEMSDFSRDYLSTLARSGKLAARRVGRSWYISKHALENFVVEQRNRHVARQKVRAASLRAQYSRTSEIAAPVAVVDHVRERVSAALARHSAATASWQAVPAPTGLAHELARASTHVPIHAVSPAMEFVHRLIALAFAFTLTLGSYALLDPHVGSFAIAEFQYTAQNMNITAHTFNPSSISRAFDAAEVHTAQIAQSVQSVAAAVGAAFGRPNAAGSTR